MYHESVHEHALGKIGALREIALAQEEGYRWWYGGFYIHSCPKMRYKGEYAPQYFLDPESYGWDLLSDEVKRKLDANRYLSLSCERAELAGAPILPPPAQSAETTPVAEIETAVSSDTSVINGTDEADAEDSDDDPPVPNPDLPIYARNIPGIMTKDQLLASVDLDHIKLRIREVEAETFMLVDWEERSLDNVQSIKARIAELAAAVGKDLAAEMVVSFD